LLHPTEITPENLYDCYFLRDIEVFIKKYKFLNIDLDILCLNIYNIIPIYQVHHLRLWLYGYIDIAKYDYIGFRERYKELTKEEQLMFKKIGDNYQYNKEIISNEASQVTPCTKIISKTNTSLIYSATIENIYFSDGKIKLRKENELYTEFKVEPFSSSGLNRIPISDRLNKYIIEIEVSTRNEIINVIGLDSIFTSIHTGEIEKALGVVVDPSVSVKRHINKSYVEDWRLRKK